MLWEVDIYPGQDQVDREGNAIANDAKALGLDESIGVRFARGYLIEGSLEREDVDRLVAELLVDGVVEQAVVGKVGDGALAEGKSGESLVCVFPKPGVTDPVAESTKLAIHDFGMKVDAVCTLRKYWLSSIDEKQQQFLTDKRLANGSIEQVVYGPIQMERIQLGQPYKFKLETIKFLDLNDEQLLSLSRERQLSMTLPELQTVQSHFRELGREPTDAELETVAQTWSEHCSHKTLAGKIDYQDENGSRKYNNMLKETIFSATTELRKKWGEQDWCVSVFKDNAGIVKFDDDFNLCFKVETHNRPSAIEPYGGANTGIGGVIRDTLGTGLGAKPIANTDVFCFAHPETPADELPPGVLHPKRVLGGVVAGVRDYGNRMGIPTVNGALYFDQRYVGNPLVFCGNVGLIPVDKSFKEPQPNDYIVTVGGRTGRDGIHGATFSSVELTSESETLSGGAVQIGNAITEKMVVDVLLQTRDEELFSAVTDCGAGGFSSAVGEMGEEIGAEVWLDKAPLKYDGLSYTEIWISEAQERMVFAVPEDKWERFHEICAAEGVEATIIGKFTPTKKLKLKYFDEVVADVEMSFLHDGRPPVVRTAVFESQPESKFTYSGHEHESYNQVLLDLLASPNIASKEWVIRQYDHEVQGGSVIKPLVGVTNDGPSDAAVVRPRLDSHRGAVISNGMNPYYGDLDPYHMAASAIDEAMRNCVAVGGNPEKVAVLDNFCWGYTDRPETLGRLVRAAIACQDLALELGTPFISGKDSLNNEYSFKDSAGKQQTISIPSTLLISALGQIDDVRKCVTMDLKDSGNLLYLVGSTFNELGGSHLGVVTGATGGHVPQVNAKNSMAVFKAIHQAIQAGSVRGCHDLSEGGLAVCLAEMAFAGGLGAHVKLSDIEIVSDDRWAGGNAIERDQVLMFSESNARFVCEVSSDHQAQFEQAMQGVSCVQLGTVTNDHLLQIQSVGDEGESVTRICLPIDQLKEAWQSLLK